MTGSKTPMVRPGGFAFDCWRHAYAQKWLVRATIDINDVG